MARLTSAERQARYRAKHPEKIKAYKESDARKESDKKYREVHGTHPMNLSGTEEYKKYRSTERYRTLVVNKHLKRSYGITLQDYNAMLDEQQGVCKICSSTYSRKSQTQLMPLFVDHNHETGQVRGLLCSKCNSGLGMFNDNPEILMTAISYLKAGG